MISRYKDHLCYFQMTSSCRTFFFVVVVFKLLLKTCCTNKVHRYYYFLQVIWGVIGTRRCLCIPVCFYRPFNLNSLVSLPLCLFCHRTLLFWRAVETRGRASSVDTSPSAEGWGRAAFRLSYRYQKGGILLCVHHLQGPPRTPGGEREYGSKC